MLVIYNVEIPFTIINIILKYLYSTFHFPYENEDHTCSYNDLIVKRSKLISVALKMIDLIITIKTVKDIVTHAIDFVKQCLE